MTSCQKCPLDTDTCPGWGYEDSDLVFVGQAPARTEIKQQKPFVGKSGQLLRATLQQVGMDLDNYYTTNSVLCRLPDDTDTPYQTCRSRLVEEIQRVDPQLIVCLGADAWKSVYDTDSGVTNKRGRFYWSSEFKATVLPTLHPAACLYEGKAVSSAFRDFKKDLWSVANRQIAGGFMFDDIRLPKSDQLDHDTPDIQNKVIKTPEQAKDFYRYCVDASSVDVVASDIESTGFNPRTEDLLCVGFCFQSGQTAVLTPEAIEENVLGYFLTETDLDFVWHNGKFDVKFLREKGIDAEVHEDTMLLSYMLDERSGVHSLGYLAGQHFNAPDWESEVEEHMDEDGDYASIPGHILYEYNSLDVHYTYRLYHKLSQKVSGGLSEAYRGVLIPASNTLADVELEGLLMDNEHLSAVDEEFSTELEKLRNRLIGYATSYGWNTERYVQETGAVSEPDEINFNSDQQMWHLFFDLIQLPKYRGDRSVREEARNWMKEMTSDEDKLEFIELYDEYKSLRHKYDLYIGGLPKYQEDDGRVRSDLSLHTTCTGRLSSKNPNLQNIARDERIKNTFVAPEGKVLLEADFSQLEVRLMAQLSGDEFLQSVYTEGGDLHDRMAERLFGEDFTKEERVVAKTVNFGVAYGIQSEGLSSRTHLDEDQAERIIDRWFKMAPGVQDYFQDVRDRVDEQGYIESWFGRRRRFPLKTRENKHKIEREACNFVIQSPGSDITTLSAVELNKCYKVVMLVHDSVLIEAPEDRWKEVGEHCLNLMPHIAESRLNADIPFEVDVEVGKRWGELKEVDLQ